MDFTSMLGGMGGGSGGDKEFGSSTASTSVNFSRGRDGGLTPEWVTWAVGGALALAAFVLVLTLARK